MARNGKRGRAVAPFYYRGQRAYRVYSRRDNGRWYADYKESGKRVRLTLRAATKPEAEAAIQELDAQPEAAEPKANTGEATLEEASKQFLEHCAGRDLAPTTMGNYRATLESFGRFCVAKSITLVGQVDLPELEGFHAQRIKTEHVSPVTAFRESVILKMFFKFAAHPARRLAQRNPAAAWEVRKPARTERYCYTTDEVRKLVEGARNWLRPVLTVLAYSGLRIGELINLRWQDVDTSKGLIHVRAREDWKPKGRRDRTVPIHPSVSRAIPPKHAGKYVFVGPRGGKLKESHCLECLKTDRERLGIHQGTLHTFRHYFVSLCASSGKVPLSTCMSWVGHRDAQMVWHYYHLSETASREAMERLAETAS